MTVMMWSLPFGNHLFRRRGVGLASTVVVLLVTAVAMDRIVEELSRSQMNVRATAAAEIVRSWATAAAILDANPFAPPNALPHLLDRQDVALTHREIVGGPDELVIDWSGMPPRAVPHFQARVGEWLGIDPAAGEPDRIITELTLTVDAVPLPRPELVLRASPDMQAGMELPSVTGAGAIEATTGIWADARVLGTAGIIRPTGSNAVRARGGSTGGTLTTTAAVIAQPMGMPTPVRLVMADGTTRASVRTGRLAVGGDFIGDTLTAAALTGDGAVSADVLVPDEGVDIDLAAAGIRAVTTGSARTTNLVTGPLQVGIQCSGCRP
ncbi:MAG: hypothetical protein OXF88_16015 [Rhodobacteraceae bacterium]|nr:hypothetical protein [Paracoccaceae bacterium]